jgi:Na+-transporting NADH:ubiquinone oxidoreductase subunit NqrD
MTNFIITLIVLLIIYIGIFSIVVLALIKHIYYKTSTNSQFIRAFIFDILELRRSEALKNEDYRKVALIDKLLEERGYEVNDSDHS